MLFGRVKNIECMHSYFWSKVLTHLRMIYLYYLFIFIYTIANYPCLHPLPHLTCALSDAFHCWPLVFKFVHLHYIYSLQLHRFTCLPLIHTILLLLSFFSAEHPSSSPEAGALYSHYRSKCHLQTPLLWWMLLSDPCHSWCNPTWCSPSNDMLQHCCVAPFFKHHQCLGALSSTSSNLLQNSRVCRFSGRKHGF